MNTPADEDRTTSRTSLFKPKLLIAAAVFIGLAVYMSTVVPTIEIAWVSAILILTIYLFAFEVVSVDVAAATVMVLLGLSTV